MTEAIALLNMLCVCVIGVEALTLASSAGAGRGQSDTRLNRLFLCTSATMAVLSEEHI